LIGDGGAAPLLAGEDRVHQIGIENTDDKSVSAVSFGFQGSHPNLVVTAVNAPGWNPWVEGDESLVSGTLSDGTSETLEITWGYPCDGAVSGQGNDCTISYEWLVPTDDPNLKIIDTGSTGVYCVKPSASLTVTYSDCEGDPTYFTSGAVDTVTFKATLTPLELDNLQLSFPGIGITLDFWEADAADGPLFEPADRAALINNVAVEEDGQGNLIWRPWNSSTSGEQELSFPVRPTYIMYLNESTHEAVESTNLTNSLSVEGLCDEDGTLPLMHTPESAEFKRVWIAVEPSAVPSNDGFVSAGDVLTYNMTLKNEGAVPLIDGELSFPLASMFDDHEVTCVGGTHSFTSGVEAGSIVITDIGQIAQNSEVVFSYADTIPGSTEQGAGIDYPEIGATSIWANGTYVEAPLEIIDDALISHTVANSKLELVNLWLDYEGDDDDLLAPGDPLTLSIVLENQVAVENAGDATRGLAIQVTHPLDEVLLPLQTTGSGVSIENEQILITGSTIQPGDQETFSLEFIPYRHIPNDALIAFQGGLEGMAGDVSWTTSRWVSDTTTVGPEASVHTANYELDFQAEISSGPVQFGREFELTLTVDNVGRYEAPALVIESALREPQGMLLGGFPGVEGVPDDVQIGETPEGNEFLWTVPVLGAETRGKGKTREATSLSIAYTPLLGDDIAFEYSFTSIDDDVIIPLPNFTLTSDLVLPLIPIGEPILPLALFPCPYSGEGPARIVYHLSERVASVRYRILDIRGVVVARSVEDIEALAATSFGVGTIPWNGEARGGGRLPNGPYFIELIIEREDGSIDRRIQKMAILR